MGKIFHPDCFVCTVSVLPSKNFGWLTPCAFDIPLFFLLTVSMPRAVSKHWKVKRLLKRKASLSVNAAVRCRMQESSLAVERKYTAYQHSHTSSRSFLVHHNAHLLCYKSSSASSITFFVIRFNLWLYLELNTAVFIHSWSYTVVVVIHCYCIYI